MPRISVIVPSYRRPEALGHCLRALALQNEPDFEVVVVDDGSPESLEPVCARFGPRVRFLRQENRGPAVARNSGAKAASGALLAFTDDDCRPRPDWLRRLRERQGGARGRLVGGRVANGLPRNPCATASQLLCDYLYEYHGASGGEAPFFTSNNMACDRAAFEALGGFDPSFPLAAAEDRDFGLRWRDAGGELAYAPDAVIDHFHDLTMRRFWRQHANYGRGARHLHGVLASRGSAAPRREPLGFYLGLVTYPLRRQGFRGVSLSALIAATQAAMVWGYARARG